MILLSDAAIKENGFAALAGIGGATPFIVVALLVTAAGVALSWNTFFFR